MTPPKPEKKKKKDDKTEKSEKEKPKKEKKSGQKIDQTPTKSDNPGPSGEGKAPGSVHLFYFHRIVESLIACSP